MTLNPGNSPRISNAIAIVALGAVMTVGGLDHASAQSRPLTAIDIALEPNQTMNSRAHAANAALLKDFPQGYALDDTHHAHISVLAGFVPTVDLPALYVAAGKVFAKEAFTTWKLTAFEYYYIPLGSVGLGGIVVEPTPDLLRLQSELDEAVSRYFVKTGTADAFYTTPEEPHIIPVLVETLGHFMEENGGDKFSPHVTIGIGTKAFLDALLAQPFDSFTFSPASASVYQFGDYGTARKILKEFPGKG